MQRFRPLLATVGLALALPALAQQPPQQPRPPAGRPAPPSLAEQSGRAVQSCIGTDRTAAKLAECIDRQRTALEPRLAQTMARAQAALASPRREAFDAADAAWATYRDRQCAFVALDRAGGPPNATDRADCLLDFTVSRIEELEEALRPPPAQTAARAPGQPPRPPAK